MLRRPAGEATRPGAAGPGDRSGTHGRRAVASRVSARRASVLSGRPVRASRRTPPSRHSARHRTPSNLRDTNHASDRASSCASRKSSSSPMSSGCCCGSVQPAGRPRSATGSAMARARATRTVGTVPGSAALMVAGPQCARRLRSSSISSVSACSGCAACSSRKRRVAASAAWPVRLRLASASSSACAVAKRSSAAVDAARDDDADGDAAVANEDDADADDDDADDADDDDDDDASSPSRASSAGPSRTTRAAVTPKDSRGE